jgi:hypothetical protein
MFIWTRLPNESSRAYQAFELYKSMGPGTRSIEKVGKRLGKNPTALGRLSSKYGWVERANAYDVYIGQKKAEKMAEEIVEMDRRHARQAQALQEDALKLFDRMKHKTESNLSCLNMFPEYDVTTTKSMQFMSQFFRMYKEAAGIERAVRGEERKKAGRNSDEEGAPPSAVEAQLIEDGSDQEGSVKQDAPPENEAVPAEAGTKTVKGIPALRAKFKKRPISSNAEPDTDKPQGESAAEQGSGKNDGETAVSVPGCA